LARVIIVVGLREFIDGTLENPFTSNARRRRRERILVAAIMDLAF